MENNERQKELSIKLGEQTKRYSAAQSMVTYHKRNFARMADMDEARQNAHRQLIKALDKVVGLEFEANIEIMKEIANIKCGGECGHSGTEGHRKFRIC